jgi:hypothetical protein
MDIVRGFDEIRYEVAKVVEVDKPDVLLTQFTDALGGLATFCPIVDTH